MSKKDTQTPDNSPAMIAMSQQAAMSQMHDSDNQFMVGMAQTGAQIMQSQGLSILGNNQIQASTEMASERNDTRLEIARMNYDLKKSGQEDSHAETMEQLRLRGRQIDAEAAEKRQI